MMGFEYGNTRLRARGAELFDGEAYRNLLVSGSVDGLLGALALGPYAPGVEMALGRYRGLRRLDEAVRVVVAGRLNDLLSFYGGEIKEHLRLYLSRWDIRNVRVILRSLANPGREITPTAFLVAVGRLDEAALAAVAAQRNVSSAVDLLSLWRLPSPAVIRHLHRGLPRYRATGDIQVLERTLDEAFGESVEDLAASGGAEALLGLLQRDVDRNNLISALRWRDSSGRPEEPFVPIRGGRAPSSVWLVVADLIERDRLEEILAGRVPNGWLASVSAWSEHGDLTKLESDIEHVEAANAVVRFRRGDPLGLDIPLAFVDRADAEAKNVRLIGRAVADDLPRDEAFAQLLGVVS